MNLERQTSCYYKNGLIYCKEDYQSQFTARCGRCSSSIKNKELVMRAKQYVYHLSCFSCVVCGSALSPGSYFALNPFNATLFCQLHYEPLLYVDVSPSGTPRQRLSCPVIDDVTTVPTSGHVKKSKKKKLTLNVDSMSCLVQGDASASELSELTASQQHQRNKRMRTSFKHHQLKAMKAYFSLNHNPDAKDLKQLAQRTGLTKRVLQVWFQNARAKYRRSLQVSEGGSGESGNASGGSDNVGENRGNQEGSSGTGDDPKPGADDSNPNLCDEDQMDQPDSDGTVESADGECSKPRSLLSVSEPGLLTSLDSEMEMLSPEEGSTTSALADYFQQFDNNL